MQGKNMKGNALVTGCLLHKQVYNMELIMNNAKSANKQPAGDKQFDRKTKPQGPEENARERKELHKNGSVE